MKVNLVANYRCVALCLLIGLGGVSAQAGLFDDEEARRAILDLRQRVDTIRLESEQGASRSGEDVASLRRSLLDLQNQIEVLRAEMAKLRGMNEQMSRDLADMQRQQKDVGQSLENRLRQFEPVKVTVDGREFLAEPAEKRDYESALAVFRKGDFPSAQTFFVDFLRRYSQSGYASSALFWLGNAQYATRDYKEAILNFRNLIAREPDHLRTPEAALSIANCQIELKDTRAAKKTLEDLVQAYPQTEAAVAAKERLLRLK